MKTIACGLAAITLAALTAGCGYSERTYAVQAPAPSYERAVAVPGAEYYGDRYYTPSYYYPSRTAYVRYY
ncbi:MAG: hypothetical protein E6G95_20730 [Alphaproteobacteria bacterium]|jgi:hypothetical protein|nr:MAG: hypothetical protein E6G95_20730 [Alphaproteobacteria bacterium]